LDIGGKSFIAAQFLTVCHVSKLLVKSDLTDWSMIAQSGNDDNKSDRPLR
jgi:hypothetical protein